MAEAPSVFSVACAVGKKCKKFTDFLGEFVTTIGVIVTRVREGMLVFSDQFLSPRSCSCYSWERSSW